MRCCRGQASIEYLGVVGLVALVLGALAVPALAGQDVAGAVVAQVRRALCVAGRGDCDEDRRPCAVDTHGVREAQHVNVGFLRYGQERLTMRETRSDGTVAVTVLKDHRLGVDAGIGVDAHAGSYAFGASVGGALLARLGSGSTIVFRSARDADRGMALLSQGRTPPGATRVRLARGGLGAELEALGAKGGVRVADDLVVGRSFDEATGRTTYSLRGAGEAQGALGSRAPAGTATPVSTSRSRCCGRATGASSISGSRRPAASTARRPCRGSRGRSRGCCPRAPRAGGAGRSSSISTSPTRATGRRPRRS